MNTLISDFNRRRKEKGLKPLTPDEENIITKAQIKAQDSFNKFGDFFKIEIKKSESDYEKIRENVKAYFDANGLILPIDYNEFMLSFWENPDNDTPLFKEFKKINRQHFKDFHLKIDKSLKKPLKKIKSQKSYVWQGNPDIELPELYRLMKDTYKLIDPETTIEQFKDSFITEDIENIIPLIWLETNRLLVYFLDNYFKGQNYQSIAENRKQFSRPNKILLNANDLSVAKNNYEECGKPKGYEKIDLILKDIKKH